MAESTRTRRAMRPHFEEIQAHYDLSDDFFGLFQDPSRTYSCAFFERDDMTLEEAQIAKIDLALGKLDLQPGMTLLDVGCGWGSVMKRAVEKLRRQRRRPDAEQEPVRVTASSCSTSSTPTARGGCCCAAGRSSTSPSTASSASRRSRRSRRSATRRSSRRATASCPTRPDGAADDHGSPAQALAGDGHPDHDDRPEVHAVHRQGDLPGRRRSPATRTSSNTPGRRVFACDGLQLLDEHYVRTLDTWARHLEAAHDEAVAATSEEVYDRYMRYLIGCTDFFQRGISELGQFTLTKG